MDVGPAGLSRGPGDGNTPLPDVDSLLEIAVERTEAGVVLRLSGELDRSSAVPLASAILSQENLQALDLREVTFIDCGGLQTLVAASNWIRAEGRNLPILPGVALLRIVRLLDMQGALDMAERG